ncbi:hypothetical protein N0V95_001914 [Ascochyta clinopodiicola]|nr:hypothetical protein N0V95_001914 [Ascochyta clinopodiicola]
MGFANQHEDLMQKEPLSVSESQQTADHFRSAVNLKAAQRKVDKRLLCWYAFVLLFMRTNMINISNTAIMNLEEGNGIKKELGGLSSSEWAWALSIFYYPYMVFEPLATLALKHFRPNVWMSRIMLTWGIISMCQAATQNYAGILACRFFLGAAEAGFYPGVLFHMSFWYSTDHLPLRIAFLYACGMFAGTISGLLAYAVSHMNGVAGLSGWRWLFILEGIPAVLLSIYTWFNLPNYPETANFLSDEERAAIVADLPNQAPTMHAKTFDFDQIKQLFRSTTFIPFLMIWITHGIGAWLIHTKRLSPWVAGLGVEITQIVCYILLITVKQPIAKYIFVMIATAASQSFFAIIWPERIRAARGTTTAGLAIGITNASGQFMGIVGPQIYQPKFGPAYHVSYGCSIALLVTCVGAVLTCWTFVMKDDRRRGLEDTKKKKPVV